MAGANRELPARIPSELEKGLRQAAERIAEAGRGPRRGPHRFPLGWARSSWSTRSTPCPARWPATCGWPRAVPFATLLADLLAEARERPTHGYSAAGADGSVLRSAGSIAGKLG